MGWKKALKKVGNVVSLGSLGALEKGLKSFSGSGMAGTLLGGGLGFAVGGPIGGLVGASLGGQFDTNRANADAVAAANDANVALWREQAAYNTPANQVARLRAAGLNPNLFYSQGDTGNMSSSPTMKAAQYDYNYAQAIDKVAMYYQMKNIQAQNANLRAQTDNINAQTALRRTESDYQKLQLNYFKKYGFFANQSDSSVLRQTFQDTISDYGDYYSADALKEAVKGSLLREGDLQRDIDLSPEKIGREAARKLARKGYTWDKNAQRWIRL